MLDIAFNSTGTLLASVSADWTGKIYSLGEISVIASLEGHNQSISKVQFNPQGKKVLTCSEDHSAKLWDLEGKKL